MKRGPKSPEDRRIQAELKQAIVRALSRALTLDTAAAIAGVSAVTVRNWQKEDEKFLRSCARARAEARALPTEVVWDAVAERDLDTAKWWLERRDPAFRKDGRHQDADEAPDQPRQVVVRRRLKQPAPEENGHSRR